VYSPGNHAHDEDLMLFRWALTLLLLLPLIATHRAAASTLDPAGARRAQLERDLLAAGRPDLARAWTDAILAEREANDLSDEDPERAEVRFRDAIRSFESVAAVTGDDGTPYWRSARAHWLLGEMYPVEDKERRLQEFTASVEMATRGIEVDPRCGECMLWKFTSLGRVSTTKGLLSGLWDASEMAELLKEGIALAPTHQDHANNSTLGNLHYGSAVFYRVLPDWRWLGWLIGVRGDKERGLEHARQALALHPARLDYQLEVGSQLLCLGAPSKNASRRAPRISRGSSTARRRRSATCVTCSPPASCSMRPESRAATTATAGSRSTRWRQRSRPRAGSEPYASPYFSRALR
jgi:tetratricopeptide (TPR) repeat protein